MGEVCLNVTHVAIIVMRVFKGLHPRQRPGLAGQPGQLGQPQGLTAAARTARRAAGPAPVAHAAAAGAAADAAAAGASGTGFGYAD